MKKSILIILVVIFVVVFLIAGIGYYLDFKNSDSGNLNSENIGVDCIQVIVYAQDPKTGKCKTFPNPCVIPKDWGSCEVANFEDCEKVGNPVMESYPRKCIHNDQLFVEEVDAGILE